MTIPHKVPEPIAETPANQYEIGWLKALTGLLSHSWTEIQCLHLKYMRITTTGEICMTSLIRNLLDTAWDIWSHWNYILHTTDEPTKISILRKVNARIEYHHVRGMVGLSEHCQFLFHTSLFYILSPPFRKQLPWLAKISSARTCYRRHTSHILTINDSLLLDQIL